MALKFKLTEDGKAIAMSEKGLPMVIDDSDPENPKEFALDAVHHYNQIPRLREEAKTHRLAKEAAEKMLKLFTDAGIDTSSEDAVGDWLSNATKAIDTMKNIDDKKLVDAGEVETIERQAQEALQSKLTEQEKRFKTKIESLEKDVTSKDATIYQLMVADRFNTSEFVQKKLAAMTPKMARKYFGDNFKVETDEEGRRRVVGYYNNGERIYSNERAGELADFEEALQILTDKAPDRDNLLAATTHSGSGAGGCGGIAGTGVEKNPFVKGPNLNLTEQGKIYRENPQLAERLKTEAEAVGGK